MRFLVYPLFIIAIILLALPSFCQDSTNNKPSYYISASAHHGYILKHRASVADIGNIYPRGIEFNIGYQTNGNKYWHQLHNFPRIGLQVLLYDLRKPEIFGYSVHLTPYMDLFLLKSKRHDLFVKIGTGLGYYTKHYNENTNPENLFMGQSICMTGVLSLSYRFQFTPSWSAIAGLNFNHGSNGSLQMPNLGINIPSMSAGVHYTTHPERIKFKKTTLSDYKKSLNLFVSVSFSRHQAQAKPSNNKDYFATTQSIALVKRFTRKSAALVGFDACYDASIHYNVRESDDYENGKYPIWRYAAVAGYEFLVHEKLRVTMQNGFYLYNPYRLNGYMYQRFGFKYLPHKNFYLGYYLKTHFAKADFWEFAIGTRF